MAHAQFFLTKLKKAGRTDIKTQNRPQFRFGRTPKATYRPGARLRPLIDLKDAFRDASIPVKKCPIPRRSR